jgi:four helix bundle protein
VRANYREASRARSKKEFISKIGIVEQEADETPCWLELLTDSGIVNKKLVGSLIKESDELLSIFVTTGKSSK